MATPPFDAAKAVSFDLARGVIALRSGASSVLVPVDALEALCRAAGAEPTATFARSLGDAMGAEVQRRLQASGVDPKQSSIDTVLAQLAGAWATQGFGSLSIERWGRALVFVADHVTLPESGDRLLASALAAAVSVVSGSDCRCIPLARDGRRVRLLVTSSEGAARATAWLGQGLSWGEVLVRLHAGAPRQEQP